MVTPQCPGPTENDPAPVSPVLGQSPGAGQRHQACPPTSSTSVTITWGPGVNANPPPTCQQGMLLTSYTAQDTRRSTVPGRDPIPGPIASGPVARPGLAQREAHPVPPLLWSKCSTTAVPPSHRGSRGSELPTCPTQLSLARLGTQQSLGPSARTLQPARLAAPAPRGAEPGGGRGTVEVSLLQPKLASAATAQRRTPTPCCRPTSAFRSRVPTLPAGSPGKVRRSVTLACPEAGR